MKRLGSQKNNNSCCESEDKSLQEKWSGLAGKQKTKDYFSSIFIQESKIFIQMLYSNEKSGIFFICATENNCPGLAVVCLCQQCQRKQQKQQ